MMMLGLGVTATQRVKSDPFVPSTTVNVNPFSRDRTLFDSGCAFGRNEANIVFSGSGTPEETVQFRILREDGDTGAWADFATIDPQGQWSGAMLLPRSSAWMRAEVRIKSEPQTRAVQATRFGVGHVVALWGQSEIVRIRSVTYDATPPEPLLADDMVQALWFDGAPSVLHITQSNFHTSALVAMANTFIAERPDDKFAIVFQAVSGTGFRELVDDGDSGRSWSDDAALHAFATADGQHIGLSAVSWFATPGALGDHYAEALFPLFTGKTVDGAPVSFPATITYNSTNSYQADHWFGELYNPAFTKWLPYGPHRFDIGADMRNATVLASGATQNNLRNKQAVRESWREMVENPHADGLFLPLGPEPLAYVNGVPDGAGGWSDQSHPSGSDPDGAPRFARLVAHSVLQSSGLSNWHVPEFDQCVWEPDGSHVEVWSTAGPITTIRHARAEAALGSDFAHWTDVFGWQINGAPASRAELVNGRVRLYPETGSFTASDRISYGEGGASGMTKFPEDFYAGAYKNLPIVDVGASLVEGISLRPLPDEAVLSNTLVPVDVTFATTETGPHFADPAILGDGVSKLQVEIDIAPTVSASGGRILCALTGNYLRMEILPNGKLRLRVRDADGTVHVDGQQTASGIIVSDVRVKIVLSVDLAAGFARIWVNGASVMDETFVPTSGLFPGNRTLLALAALDGAYQVVGMVYTLGIWKDATSDGSAITSPAYKELSGPAEHINSDPWLLGDDASLSA